MATYTNAELARVIRRTADKIVGSEKYKNMLLIAADRLERTGHAKNQHSTVLYTVYENRTDKCLAFDLPACKCAEILGITVGSFYSAVTKGRGKWTIIKRYADE